MRDNQFVPGVYELRVVYQYQDETVVHYSLGEYCANEEQLKQYRVDTVKELCGETKPISLSHHIVPQVSDWWPL